MKTCCNYWNSEGICYILTQWYVPVLSPRCAEGTFSCLWLCVILTCSFILRSCADRHFRLFQTLHHLLLLHSLSTTIDSGPQLTNTGGFCHPQMQYMGTETISKLLTPPQTVKINMQTRNKQTATRMKRYHLLYYHNMETKSTHPQET